ncbi:unnamed protein product (macronuclear) [Paramecium tetraurelia]|uniref:Uncharacterized protein n=1 Tax=Paramecium tetraurelia TaxID=5888 RepID=A0CJA8_PARTE|nr:uncharacterized protein GSPATT00000586001 [Paramecium tetraurelia]CAK70875.1 unnamed protein product [Paramecium tetraurelia]|eukprot:XP_001438272.1 hypothetical protein (macronuclear) [Paramecium tetraurelia strain d4-2]
MNYTKILTTSIALLLLLVLCIQNDNINSKFLKLYHKDQNLITGKVVSQYGQGIPAKLEIKIENNKQSIESNKEGIFTFSYAEGKLNQQYSVSISITELSLGYVYSNPIAQLNVVLKDKVQLPNVILNEGGYGALVIKGSFNEKLSDTHLSLIIEEEKQQLQTNAITTSTGQFEFHIFGIKSLPKSALLSVLDNNEQFEPIQSLPIKLEGPASIIQLKQIELQSSKCNKLKEYLACRLKGCKSCVPNNQKCQECFFGYKLDNNQLCKFGNFKGVGIANFQFQNFGPMTKIIGTLLNQEFKPVTNTLVCIKTDSLCVATGGSNRFGNDLIISKVILKQKQQHQNTDNYNINLVQVVSKKRQYYMEMNTF